MLKIGKTKEQHEKNVANALAEAQAYNNRIAEQEKIMRERNTKKKLEKAAKHKRELLALLNNGTQRIKGTRRKGIRIRKASNQVSTPLSESSEEEELNNKRANEGLGGEQLVVKQKVKRQNQSSKLKREHQLTQIQEAVEGLPSNVGVTRERIDGMDKKMDELHAMVKAMVKPIQNIESLSEANTLAVDNVRHTIIDRSKRLEELYKKMRHGRSGGNSSTNLIIYYICLYYKMLWTLIRLSLEFNHLMARTGVQWCNACPLWTLGVGQCIVLFSNWVLFNLIINGAVLAVVPVPQLSIHPYVFNEGMLLDLMFFQLGHLIHESFSGILRIKGILSPSTRGLRILGEQATGIEFSQLGSTLWSYVKGPVDSVSGYVVQKWKSGMYDIMPESASSFVSGIGSAASSGLGTVGSAAVSGLGTVGSAAVSGLGTVGSAVGSRLGSGAGYLSSAAVSGTGYVTSWWKGTGGAKGNRRRHKVLNVNDTHKLTIKTYNLIDFEEFETISFLNKTQQEEFNTSTIGKNFNKLKSIMDKKLQSQLEQILQYDELKVSMFLVEIGNMLDVIVDYGIPYFKDNYTKNMKLYKDVIKYDLKLIDVKLLFPELLNLNVSKFLNSR